MKCSNCQSKLPETAKFCAHCGTQVTTVSSNATWRHPVFLLAIGLVVVIAFFVYFSIVPKSDSSPASGIQDRELDADAPFLPNNLQVITPDNVTAIKQVGLLGRGVIEEVAWLLDGQVFAVGTSIGTYLYDVSSREEIRFVPTDGFVSLSPGGHTFASASPDGTIHLWDVETGHELYKLSGHTGNISNLAFTLDGRVLASGSRDEGVVQLWDTDTGQSLHTLHASSNTRTTDIALSPDGQKLAWASGNGNDGSVQFWDTISGQHLQTLQDLTSHVFSVAFSPDGQMLASGSLDGTVRLWDASNGRSYTHLK